MALSKETRYDLFMESIPNIVSYLIQQAIIHGKISLEEINLPPCSFDYSHGAEGKINLLTEIILKYKIIQADIRKNEIDIITDNNTKELFSLGTHAGILGISMPR